MREKKYISRDVHFGLGWPTTEEALEDVTPANNVGYALQLTEVPLLELPSSTDYFMTRTLHFLLFAESE